MDPCKGTLSSAITWVRNRHVAGGGVLGVVVLGLCYRCGAEVLLSQESPHWRGICSMSLKKKTKLIFALEPGMKGGLRL